MGKVVDSFEYLVDRVVATSAIPPPLDDSLVVTEEYEVVVGLLLLAKKESKAFEADGLGPGNVSFAAVKGLPSRNEPPSPPLSRNDDRDADS